ncbi:MAG: lipid A export permease/ATP-binding protein MsbA [Gammaproteobacteria bacterium]|nr:lipid A export permease/ATP-binding protein MsbA [Gammaproteobacteria bacterium]
MSTATNTASGTKLYRRLLGYIVPYKGIFLVAVVGMIIVAATEPMFAKLMEQITGEGFVNKNPEFIELIPWLVIGLFLMRGVGGFFGTYAMRWVGRRVIFDLRRDMFDTLTYLPTGFYDRHGSALLVSKLIYDAEQVDAATTSAVTTLIKDSASVIGLLGFLFYQSWQLTITFLVVAPILGWFVRIISKRFRIASENIQLSVGRITHVVKEAIEAQIIVKAFGGQQYERDNFNAANNQNRQQAMKKATVAAASLPVIEFVASLAFAWIIYLAAKLALEGLMDVAAFVSYVIAMLMLMGPARRLTKINEPLQAGLAAARSTFAMIDEAREPDTGTQLLGRSKGYVEFNDVSFRYDETHNKVLSKISFSIRPGQNVALVGPSGSGKSSIAALLARFYNAESGSITVDGMDINTLSLQELRNNIAVVPQETVLFDASIRRNIAYGADGKIDEKRLQSAVTASLVTEFTDRLPDGLETVIGEHGTRLSGGQRQRIAIARALYKDAPILILDEATSSLDTASEHQVKQAIDTLIKNRSTLIIAHRLSTIEHADCIVVLKQGRVVERGTHSELLDQQGEYTKLYRAQLAVDEDA